MILNKSMLREYLQEDRKINSNGTRKYPRLFGDDVWKYLISLRKFEYCLNCKGTFYSFLLKSIWSYFHYYYGIRCSFSIAPNTLGKGVRLAHRGTIVINSNAKVGDYSVIHVCVNIGANRGSAKAPILGKKVYVGPGAKIFGDITIADGVMIGANAVVNKSITSANSVAVGVPARINEVNI